MIALRMRPANVRKTPSVLTKFARGTELSAVMVDLQTVGTQTLIAKEDSAGAEGGEDVAEVVVVDLNKIVIRGGVAVAGVEDLEGRATSQETMADTAVAPLRLHREGPHLVPLHGEAIAEAAVALLPPAGRLQDPHMADLGPLRVHHHHPVDPVRHVLHLAPHPQRRGIAYQEADEAQVLKRHLVPRRESVSVPRRILVLHPRHRVVDALVLPVARVLRHHCGDHAGHVLLDHVPAAHQLLGDIVAM